jgi:hypothetical protein
MFEIWSCSPRSGSGSGAGPTDPGSGGTHGIQRKGSGQVCRGRTSMPRVGVVRRCGGSFGWLWKGPGHSTPASGAVSGRAREVSPLLPLHLLPGALSPRSSAIPHLNRPVPADLVGQLLDGSCSGAVVGGPSVNFVLLAMKGFCFASFRRCGGVRSVGLAVASWRCESRCGCCLSWSVLWW